MSPRRRSRSRTQGRPWQTLVVLLVICFVLVVAFVVAPSVAVSSGYLDRGSAADIADDGEAFLGVDVATSVDAGTTGRLVTVTNQLDQPLTIDVSSSASLSNTQATLEPGQSLTTAATVSCNSPPNELTFTIRAVGDTPFNGTLTRTTPVNTADCTASGISFGTTEIVDESTLPGSGAGKPEAVYTLTYEIGGDTTQFQNAALELRKAGSKTVIDTAESSTPTDTITVTEGGNPRGVEYDVTVRLFDTNGEIKSERIVVTDTADGGGSIYSSP